MDDAISRFDTLNQFPKVMQDVGFSAEESERAVSRLSDGIDGLPTKLDDVTSTAQQIAVMTRDLDGAVETTLALNNAFLASGASTADAQRGLQQYVQMLSRGEVDLQSWRTLQETMGVALNDVADAFGYAGQSAQTDLYDALKSGEVTFDDFNAKLVEVSNETGGFADRAQTASAGIATSWGNLRIAMAKGIAGILESFNKLSKDVTGKDLAENIDSLKVVVNASFAAIGNIIEKTTPIVAAFAAGIKATIPVVDALSPVLIGLATAYGIHKVINIATTAIKANTTTVAISTAAQNVYAVATNRLSLAVALATMRVKATGIALAAYNKIVGLAVTVQALLASGMSLASIATIGLSGAVSLLGSAIKLLMGPVGWVTLGIGALAGAVVGVVKWFNRASEEGEKLTAETESLAEASDSLNESLDETSKTYDSNIEKIENNAKANEELAQKILELSAIENKSADDKKLLETYTDELNKSVEGLNLVYGEESNALNMSSEQMMNRIGLLKEQEQLQASQERMTEIIQEQIEVESQLEEINLLREEWNQKLDDGSVKSGEHKDALAELEEQEIALGETNKLLGEERIETEQQVIESSNAVAAAQEENTGKQLILFEELSESQQATVENMKTTWEDYKDAATDMFDTLSDEMTVTTGEMKENMLENQRVMSEWADNIATLAERGIDEGLLNELREAGPESAGHVNALVNASDKELEELSAVFAKNTEVATDTMATSLGIEGSGIMEAIGHLVTDTETSLKEQMDSANFEGIGGSVTDGYVQGIDGGSEFVKDAAKKIADDSTKATKDALDINSPSGVYKDLGKNVTDGLALGIQQGTIQVLTAIKNMFKDVQAESVANFNTITRGYDRSVGVIEKSLEKLPKVTQKAMKNMMDRLVYGSGQHMTLLKNLASNMTSWFTSTPAEFNSVGKNAMAGLNNGLNAGRGQVMATARSIANGVASTMKSALKIHSPSRVMEDDVGAEVPAGLAVGIKNNARLVYQELDKLASGMMMMSTPEMALGTSRMAYAGAGVISSSSSIANDNRRSYNPQIVNHFSPAESTPSESARKQKKQQQRLAMEMGF